MARAVVSLKYLYNFLIDKGIIETLFAPSEIACESSLKSLIRQVFVS